MKRSVRIGWLARISYLAVVLLIAGCRPCRGHGSPYRRGSAVCYAVGGESLVQRVRGNDDTVSLKETDPPVPVQADNRVTVNETGGAAPLPGLWNRRDLRNSQLQVGEPQLA